MDGTLIDSTDAIYESFLNVFKKHKIPLLPKNKITKFIGYTLQDMFRFFGVSSDLIEVCCNDYKRHYTTIHRAKTTMLPNAAESIKLASKFANLGIVTTKTSHSSRELLQHFEVEKYFSVMIGREDVVHTKPHKEPIINALMIMESKNIKIDKNKSFMIGDTILDLQAAKNADIQGIGILCGYGKRADLEQFSNNIFLDSLKAVKFIQSL